MFFKGLLLLAFILSSAVSLTAQADKICEEFGHMAMLEGLRLEAPFVYGHITIISSGPVEKFPNVTVTYSNRSQSSERLTVGKSGNYCFKIRQGNGGLLIVEIDGVEVARRNVPDFGAPQKREDFQVDVPSRGPHSPPAVISSKFVHPPNEKTKEHYLKAAEFEKDRDLNGAIAEMNKVVQKDPADFIAWGHLGSLYFQNDQLEDADGAYRRSLTLREDYTPAWVNVGKLRFAQKQYPAAIEIFKHAAALEPQDARTFRLLGEAYLQNKQGTFGAQALNHAIRLDPIGQAECHLQLAHLYELAKANDLAVKEYEKFLEKVPEHPDRAKFERFINANKPKT